MKVALVQTDIIWEDIEANLAQYTAKINNLSSTVDLVVLPEMFSTGFTMNPTLLAEDLSASSTLVWMQKMAAKNQLAITASFVVKDADCFFNRMVFVYPDKQYRYYDKKHLFSLANEDQYYTAGQERVVVEYLGWKIALQVCYDLRFPVFSRIQNQDYDVLLYVASWPEKRINAWDILLRARAVENMSYVLGVNRCGVDGNEVYYSGHSQAIDFVGDYLCKPYVDEKIELVELCKDSLQKARKKLNFLNDADKFSILK